MSEELTALRQRAERAESILKRLIAEIDPGVQFCHNPDPPISSVHAWFLRMKKVADEWTELV